MEVVGHILSRKFVRPSTPTPLHLRNFKVSFLDQIAPQAHVGVILCYSANAEDCKTPETACARLEKSLGEALVEFYPLAGRFIRDELVVDCSDQGVDYSEAQVHGINLDELLQQEANMDVLDQLVPSDIGAVDLATTPIAAIQINKFSCGGLAVGICISHVVADGSSIISFINGWASAASREGGIGGAIRPSFDLTSLFPARKLAEFSPSTLKTGAVLVKKRFVFSGSAIMNLNAQATTSDTKHKLSRVVLVSALLWKVFIRLSLAKHGYLRPSLLTHFLNLRGRTALNLPENLFGNLTVLVTAKSPTDGNSVELPDLVAIIANSIHESIANCGEKLEPSGVLLTVTDARRKFDEEKTKNNELDVRRFTSWCKFPVYEADFGWGKPTWASPASIPHEVVFLMDTKRGDGVEAWVSLNENDMLKLEMDPEIAAFTSNVA